MFSEGSLAQRQVEGNAGEAARRGRVGGVLIRVGIAVLMTALALVASEWGLRYHYRGVGSSGHDGDYFSKRPEVRRNSLGFREREIPPKTPDQYRIVVVGDSFTFGQGLDERDRLSNVLAAHLGPRYEVFNFGRRGANLDDHLAILDRALSVSPDFVLLQLFTNDFELSEARRPRHYPLLPAAADRTMGRSSLTYLLVRRGWIRLQEVVGLADSYAGYLERRLRDPASRDSVKTSALLRRLFRMARAAGAGVGVVMFPATDTFGPGGSGYPYGYLHERVRLICRDQGVGCVDLFSALSRVPDPRIWWVSAVDAHPSAAANRRAAGEVVAAFASEWGGR